MQLAMVAAIDGMKWEGAAVRKWGVFMLPRSRVHASRQPWNKEEHLQTKWRTKLIKCDCL